MTLEIQDEEGVFMEKGYRDEYGNEWGEQRTKAISSPYSASLWRSIRQEWETFSTNLQFEVGNGTRVKFWHDIWCGNCPLKVTFSELLSFKSVKDSSIANVLCLSNGVPHWDVHFSRPVQDWELESSIFYGSYLFQVC